MKRILFLLGILLVMAAYPIYKSIEGKNTVTVEVANDSTVVDSTIVDTTAVKDTTVVK